MPGSNDVSGGIGMESRAYSAGDAISCCQDNTGQNKSFSFDKSFGFDKIHEPERDFKKITKNPTFYSEKMYQYENKKFNTNNFIKQND